MTSQAHIHAVARATAILAFLATVAAIAFARSFVVPLVLAALLGFLLAPLAARLERIHVARGLAAALSVLLLLGVAVAVGWFVVGEAVDLSRRLPEYHDNIQKKLRAVHVTIRGAPLFEGIENIGDQIAEAEPKPEGAPAATAPQPVAVRVVPREPSVIDRLGGVVGSAIEFLLSAVIVLLLTAFLVAYREDLRDRIVRLVSHGHVVVTTQALDEASGRMSRYLLSYLVVNVVYAVPFGLGLWALGIPNAPLWAVLACLLRFIPFVGIWIGAAFPFALSVATTEGWARSLLVLGLTAALDLVVANVVEPIVYGKRSGISPFAVMVATVFWAWIWGAPGLLLAVPMTLCLAVVGRHVPGLRFLDVLLGDEPPLRTGDRAYHRLLSRDVAGACKVAREHRTATSLAEAFDQALLPPLALASQDLARGTLDEDGIACVREGVREAADDLAAQEATARTEAIVPRGGAAVRLVPARDESDQVACEMLSILLADRGVPSEVGSSGALLGEVVEEVAASGRIVVCAVGLPPGGRTAVRYLGKRLRARAPDAKLLAAVLEPTGDRADLDARLRAAGADATAVTLAEAADAALRLRGEVVPAPAPKADRAAGAATARSTP